MRDAAGRLARNTSQDLKTVGICMSVALELCGVRSLSFAVGAYVPFATTAPVFAGGWCARWLSG